MERLAVITGIDGSGKTTLLSKLRDARPEWIVGSMDPTDWMGDVDCPTLRWTLEAHPKDLLASAPPCTRALMLLNLVFAHWEYWLAPRLADGATVILDSYYLKWFAKERVIAKVPAFFFEALRILPSPSLIIRLDVPPDIAFRRKGSLDAHDVVAKTTADDFIPFQTAVASELDQVMGSLNSEIKRVDASDTEELVYQASLSILESWDGESA